MANGDMAKNGDNTFELQDASTRIGILSQRTATMESSVGDLRRDLVQLGQTVNNTLSVLSSRFDDRFTSLSAAMAERGKPNFQALGVMLTAMAIVGGLLYWPIREATNDMKAGMALIVEKMVTREELNWRSERGKEDRERTQTALIDLRAISVTRNEWTERNSSRDLQIANLQRELDDLKRNNMDTYNVRDVILDLKSQIQSLQAEVYVKPKSAF